VFVFENEYEAAIVSIQKSDEARLQVQELVLDLRDLPSSITVSLYVVADSGAELRRIASRQAAGTVLRRTGTGESLIVELYGVVKTVSERERVRGVSSGSVRIHAITTDGSVYSAPPLHVRKVNGFVDSEPSPEPSLSPSPDPGLTSRPEPSPARHVNERIVSLEDILRRDEAEITGILLPTVRETLPHSAVEEIVELLSDPATHSEGRQRIVVEAFADPYLDEDDSFNTLLVPSIAVEYREKTGASGGRWIAPTFRYVISSLFQIDPDRDEGTGPGRWQLYAYGAGLIPSEEERGTDLFGGGWDGGAFGIGWTVSLETAQRLRRRWMIPFVGFEVGTLVLQTPAFEAGVVGGVHIVSTSKFGLGVFGGWNFATTSRALTVMRGGVFCDLAINR
jgi:hypothetical protein